MDDKMIDHLFRHQYGKMVSILTRIFGFSNLESIEDAVQDTFIQAMKSWRTRMPENPEAWLTKAAKNRTIDLMRKLKSENLRLEKFHSGPSFLQINELFLDDEIEDAQLRMIFTACHPELNPKDQISFALKTIAGFSTKEIASALLLKDETIKKRIARARKTIVDKELAFTIPSGSEIDDRLVRVWEVIYLIFNEGFHSNRSEILVRKELCGEALRLCQMLLKNKNCRRGASYALYALMCFHSSRLDSKVDENNDIINIKEQDRTKWHRPLINMGNQAMFEAVKEEPFSSYHYEAAIAAEHLKAIGYEFTDWDRICELYHGLYQLHATPSIIVNYAASLLQSGEHALALTKLQEIKPEDLEQRRYLYDLVLAEYYDAVGQKKKAIAALDLAINNVKNEAEKKFLVRKRSSYL